MHAHTNFRQINRKNLYPMNGYRTCLPLNSNAFSCKITKLLSVHLERGIHRWNLHILPNKRKDCRFHLILRRIHFFSRKNLSRKILCICHNAKKEHGLVLLVFVGQQITDLRCPAKAYRKNAFRIRIKRSGMSYFFLFENATHLRHNVKACKSFFFIYVYDSVYHVQTCQIYNLAAISSTSVASISSSAPCIVQPAAFT